MKLGAILDAQGRDVVQVGGAAAFKQRSLKGYNISFEWGPDPDNRKRTDACVVIWSDTGAADRGAWCLFRRAAGKFCDPHNRPTQALFNEVPEALEMLGRAQLNIEAVTFVDVVMDCIDDLVQMPGTPPAVREALKNEAMWEVTRRDLNRKVLNETEV
jgi:hypothetical protein